jgi:hypothetical protein
MPARDRNAGGRADLRSAFEDRADHDGRHLIDRHRQDGECHDRLAAHGVDVGNRIRRRDPPEVARIIDNRHEEVGGGDDARFFVDLPDGRIIAGLGADQELPIRLRGRPVGEKILEHRRRQLATAAAAMGQARQSHDWVIHDRVLVAVSRS